MKSNMEYDRLYIRFKGRVLGPLSGEKVAELVQRGQVTKQHEISADSIEWKKAGDFPGIFPEETRGRTVSGRSKQVDESTPRGPASEPEWYANIDGINQGPVNELMIRDWVAIGRVRRDTLVWQASMVDWLPAEKVKPHWFLNTSEVDSGDSQRKRSNSGHTDAEHSADSVIAEMLQSHSWVLFLSITGLVFGVLGVMGATVSFFVVATQGGNGPAKVMAILLSVLQLAYWICWLYAAYLLLQYSQRLNVLRYRQEDHDKRLALRALGRFWKFSGIVVLVMLIALAIFVAMFVMLGLSIPLPN